METEDDYSVEYSASARALHATAMHSASNDARRLPRWLSDASKPSSPAIGEDAFTRISRMLLVNAYEQQIMGVVLLFMGINVRFKFHPISSVAGSMVLTMWLR